MAEEHSRSARRVVSAAPEMPPPPPPPEILYRALCAMKEAVAIFDAEDRFLFWNSEYASLHGGGCELRPGLPFRAFLEQGLARGAFLAGIGREEAWLAEQMQQRAESSATRADCFQVQLVDGRWLRLQRTPLPGGGWMSVGSDVTELVERQSDCKENEQQLRQLFEGSSDGMCILEERDGRWVYLRRNSALAAIHGDVGGDVIGRSYHDILPPDIAERAHARANACARSKRQLEFEEEHEIRGRRRDVRATFTPLIDADGEARQVLVVVRDTSEAMAAKRRLGQTQRLEAIGQLAGGVAHDFNNLLLIIDGYAREAREAAMMGASADEALEEVITAAARGAALVQQLLVFSRRQLAKKVVVRPAEVLEATCSLLRPLLGERCTVSCQISPAAARVCVETDVSELTQAVINLATNARDAMPSGGCIGLQMSLSEGASIEPGAPAGTHVEIAMTDTGTGIASEALDHIFEPFFTTKEQGAGTGLGLAMVYGFVQNSGGRIEVESKPGRGTTFRMFLPLVDAPPTERTADIVASGHAGQETVLLVEDDEAVLALTQRMLVGLGYKVLTATNGMEALELEMEHQDGLDFVLTDVAMPVLGGVELAEMLRAARPELPVVFMSGFPTRGALEGLGLPGGAACIQKPFQPQELSRKLRAALDVARAGRKASAA